MKQIWMVIREYRVVDPKYWICETIEDALVIANDVADYWFNDVDPSERYSEPHGDQVFNVYAEYGARVVVQPATFREKGEIKPTE